MFTPMIPDLPSRKALTYGQLSRIKIDNMREEHQEKLIRDAEKLAKQQKEEEEKAAAAEPRKAHGIYHSLHRRGPERDFSGSWEPTISSRAARP